MGVTQRVAPVRRRQRSLISSHLIWLHLVRPHFVWTECSVIGRSRSRGTLGRFTVSSDEMRWIEVSDMNAPLYVYLKLTPVSCFACNSEAMSSQSRNRIAGTVRIFYYDHGRYFFYRAMLCEQSTCLAVWLSACLSQADVLSTVLNNVIIYHHTDNAAWRIKFGTQTESLSIPVSVLAFVLLKWSVFFFKFWQISAIISEEMHANHGYNGWLIGNRICGL